MPAEDVKAPALLSANLDQHDVVVVRSVVVVLEVYLRDAEDLLKAFVDDEVVLAQHHDHQVAPVSHRPKL